MVKMNYDAVNPGTNDVQFFKSHLFPNVEEELPLISASNIFSSIPAFKWIERGNYKILILGSSKDFRLTNELNDLCGVADLVILLSQVEDYQNKMFIDTYPNKFHLILGNCSESPVLGKYERYQNTLLVKAGVEGHSIAHIEVRLSDEKSPMFEDVVFHKVNQNLIPDPEIESIVFSKKGDID